MVITYERKLNWQQIERLCLFVYIDQVLLLKPQDFLGDIISDIKSLGVVDFRCQMTAAEWDCTLDTILNDPQLCNLHMVDYEEATELKKDVLPGHRAVCFMDEWHNAYVVFRGTHGDYEWADNGFGMLLADTLQQQAALHYVQKIRSGWEVRSLTVAGHSKGGNKAQYVTIVAPEFVDLCVSVDGQGFSKEFMQKYEENIKKCDRIMLLAEQRDFVNCLGFTLGQTTYYRGWRGTKCEQYPNGNAISFFHCPDALRSQEGKFGQAFYYSTIAAVLNQLVVAFLVDDAYEHERKEAIDHIITLMMRHKEMPIDQTAQALAQLSILFLRMVALEESFDVNLMKMIFRESDVIIATFESAFSIINNNTSPLFQSYIKHLAKLIAEKPDHISNLVQVLIKFMNLLNRIKDRVLQDKKVFLYLITVVCFLLEGVIFHSKDKLMLQQLLQYFKELNSNKYFH